MWDQLFMFVGNYLNILLGILWIIFHLPDCGFCKIINKIKSNQSFFFFLIMIQALEHLMFSNSVYINILLDNKL